jgi:hypothetical protein
MNGINLTKQAINMNLFVQKRKSIVVLYELSLTRWFVRGTI